MSEQVTNNESNVSKVVTVDGLSTFWAGIKNRMYLKTEADGSFASKNGSNDQNFSTKTLTVNDTENSIAVSISPTTIDMDGDSQYALQLSCRDNIFTIPIINGTFAINNNRFDNEFNSKANAVKKTVGLNTMTFLSTNTLNCFLGFTEVGGGLVKAPRGTQVGSVLYFEAPDGTSANSETGPYGTVSGFYIVTEMTSGAVSASIFLFAPNKYAIYYSISDGLFYRYGEKMSKISSTTGEIPEGSYAFAEDSDIEGILNSSSNSEEEE